MTTDRAQSHSRAGALDPPQAAHDAPAYLTLSEAARLAPGTPSSSALWRWCRKGLRAKDGSTVFLRHVRVGRQVYTAATWLHQFFEAVAAADQKYFAARCEAAAEATAAVMLATPPLSGPPANPTFDPSLDRRDNLEAALREEGL